MRLAPAGLFFCPENDRGMREQRLDDINPFEECGGHNALGHISPGTIGCGLGDDDDGWICRPLLEGKKEKHWLYITQISQSTQMPH